MTAGLLALAGASSSRTIRVAAPSVYRKVAVVSVCRGASHLTVETFEMLEPCEGKLSRTVLRGLGGQQWPPGYPTLGAFRLLHALSVGVTEKALARTRPAAQPNRWVAEFTKSDLL